jgi:rubrerythrin
LSKGVNDQQALLIGIKCERGSHRFFKKYGERFEDSEGKQIFMEFAEEEKQHFDLLVREYKNLVSRKGRRRPAKAAKVRGRAHA